MPRKSPIADQVTAAAMTLAAERGWRALSLAEIAERARVPLPELVDHFPTKAAILDAYVRRIDQHMLAGPREPDADVRDRLFDTIMRRFDAMAADRDALSAILRESGDDPWAVVCGARRLWSSMALTLEAAGLSSSGLAGLVRTEALGALTLHVLRTFLDDDSTDLARTMAALDKALRRAEGIASLVWRQRERPREAPRPPRAAAGRA